MASEDYGIGIVLDISDITSDSSAGIGLASGVFYWITGRPGYAGSGYSGEAPASKTWYQGIITSLERIGQPNRMIDITVDGDYGSLSGFTFQVDNTSLFWNTLESNSYHVINRPVDVYIFLNDVSYHVWGGLVSKIKRTETAYTFICEDDFKTVHKVIPPNEVTETSFPNANKDDVGSPIPVCIGNVAYAKILNVNKTHEPINLVNYLGYKRSIAAALNYNSTNKTVTLLTSGIQFGVNTLKGMFLKATIGGGGTGYRIYSNTATVTTGGTRLYNTQVTLEDFYSSMVDNSAFETHEDYDKNGNGIDDVLGISIWFFEILEFDSHFIVSNGDVQEFLNPPGSRKYYLDFWDETQNDYSDISYIINNVSTSSIENLGRPGINLLTNAADLSGDILKPYTLTPAKVALSFDLDDFLDYGVLEATDFPESGLTGVECPYLIDRVRTTGYWVRYNQDTGVKMGATIGLDVWMDELPYDADFEHTYMMVDMSLNSERDCGAWSISYSLRAYDYTNRLTDQTVAEVDIFEQTGDGTLTAGVAKNCFLIPLQHYLVELAGDDDDFEDKKDGIDAIAFMDASKTMKGYPLYKLRISLDSDCAVTPSDMTVTFNQIAFVGTRDVSVINQDIYTRVKGETI